MFLGVSRRVKDRMRSKWNSDKTRFRGTIPSCEPQDVSERGKCESIADKFHRNVRTKKDKDNTRLCCPDGTPLYTRTVRDITRWLHT